MNIQLFNAPSEVIEDISTPPIGMAILANNLKKAGVQVFQDDLYIKSVRLLPRQFMEKWAGGYLKHCLESGKKEQLSSFSKKVLSNTRIRAGNVGISIASHYQMYPGMALASYLKEKGYNVYLGGQMFSIVDNGLIIKTFPRLPQIFPNQLEFFSYLKSRGEIAGFDLTSIFPNFEGVPWKLYRTCIGNRRENVIPYAHEMGCNRRCVYCVTSFTPFIPGDPLPEKIRQIIWLKREYNSNYFFFCDCAINNDREYFLQLIDELPKVGIRWGSFAALSYIDGNVAKKLKKSGCSHLLLGMESGSNRVLRLMGKPQTVESSSKILRCLWEEGIFVFLTMIVNFPGETDKEFLETRDFLFKNQKYIGGISINAFNLNENSIILKQPEKYGIRPLGRQDFIYYRYESEKLSWDQIEAEGLRKKSELERVMNMVSLKKILKHPFSKLKNHLYAKLVLRSYPCDRLFDYKT